MRSPGPGAAGHLVSGRRGRACDAGGRCPGDPAAVGGRSCWSAWSLVIARSRGTWSPRRARGSVPARPGELQRSTSSRLAILGWGMYIGSRRELVWTLRQRAERAEAEQELRVAQARSNERPGSRARCTTCSPTGSRRSRCTPARWPSATTSTPTRCAAQRRRDPGSGARGARPTCASVLGVLRDDAASGLDAPQPTYADLPGWSPTPRRPGWTSTTTTLLDGMPPRCRDGRPDDLPDRPGGHHQRPQARPGRAADACEVSGSGRSDGVDMLLRNPVGFGPAATPGAGLGLIGLSERAGARWWAARAPPGGWTFVLHGWIPWAAEQT